MTIFDDNAYIKKCPICGEKLEHEDIDYNFEGNRNEYAICNKCHISFEFYIRYGHLWKYTKSPLEYNERYKCWEDYGDHTETVYVYKKGQ